MTVARTKAGRATGHRVKRAAVFCAAEYAAKRIAKCAAERAAKRAAERAAKRAAERAVDCPADRAANGLCHKLAAKCAAECVAECAASRGGGMCALYAPARMHPNCAAALSREERPRKAAPLPCIFAPHPLRACGPHPLRACGLYPPPVQKGSAQSRQHARNLHTCPLPPSCSCQKGRPPARQLIVRRQGLCQRAQVIKGLHSHRRRLLRHCLHAAANTIWR
eukprot:6213912-Pleurochrysis_carterae.AAC.4